MGSRSTTASTLFAIGGVAFLGLSGVILVNTGNASVAMGLLIVAAALLWSASKAREPPRRKRRRKS